MNAKQLAAAQALAIANLTGPQLVEAYNKLTGQNIKKFADRKTAERRWAEALAAAAEKVAAQPAKADKPAKAPKAPKAEKTPKEPADRAAAIAASWTDPEVAAKRAQRSHVKVAGTEYKSVREAFKALGLPDSKHIKFRMELKASESGRKNFEGHTFVLVGDKVQA